ncbi:MAG TPA: transglycosylase SLT domain-containing protein, partial [Myxococcota bacterium]
YEKDVAQKSARAVGASLRAIACRSKASLPGDPAPLLGALALYARDVRPSALGDDPLVFVRAARLLAQIDAATVSSPITPAQQKLVDAERAALLEQSKRVKAPPFDVARREALADTIASLPPDTAPVERLFDELEDTTAGRAAHKTPAAAKYAPKTVVQALARANSLAERQQNDDVIALLTPFVTGAVGDKDFGDAACEARVLIGKTDRKLHKLSAARKQLDLVASKCGDDTKKRAAYLAARVAWLSKNPQASALLEKFIAAWPKDSLTDDTLLWLGDDRERNGDGKAAQAAWARILSDFEGGDMIHEARFRLAWSRAKSGDIAGARALLDEAARGANGKVDVSDRALYWRARLALAPRIDSLAPTADAKKKDAAVAELLALAAARPASWYGHLARELALSLAPSSTIAVFGHVRDDAERLSVRLSPALASEPRFVLAQALIAAGYDDEGLLALASLDGAKLTSEDRFAVALLEGRAGDPGDGHALLRDAGLALLPGTPAPDSALAWSIDWPLAYARAIDAAADENKVPRALLFGIAREESAFDADVVSWAGAVGLCQLMMPTASDEAKSKSLPVPSVDDLKDPALNARLGASHIGRRLRGMKHPALAIAAYNAGPGAVLGWSPKGPLDAWVESIPVDETRNYVKKVTGSWVTYSILDGSVDDVKFSLELK